jgi:hypothetical protein
MHAHIDAVKSTYSKRRFQSLYWNGDALEEFPAGSDVLWWFSDRQPAKERRQKLNLII